MKKSLLWQINQGLPKRLGDGKLDLEQHLEAWIESDPDLLQMGLTIIARQLIVGAGRIDLLALDPAGRLVVVEIKRGTLYRDTVTQGIDYAECINSMKEDELVRVCDLYLKKAHGSLRALLEERDAVGQLDPGQREVLLYVVGTGKTDRLERLAQFLEKSVAIYIVVFDIYQLDNGQQILLRELSEGDSSAQIIRKPAVEMSLEIFYQHADAAGIGKDFRRFCMGAIGFGLFPRLFKTSVMFTPQESRNRMIFTVWTKPLHKKLKVYLSPDAIAEFFPISVSDATAAIGTNANREFSSEEVTQLLQALSAMFAGFHEKTDAEPV